MAIICKPEAIISEPEAGIMNLRLLSLNPRLIISEAEANLPETEANISEAEAVISEREAIKSVLCLSVCVKAIDRNTSSVSPLVIRSKLPNFSLLVCSTIYNCCVWYYSSKRT